MSPEMLAKPRHLVPSKYKRLSALALIAGPFVFLIGLFSYSFNKINSLNLGQAEWSRYKKERNNYLDVKRAQLNAAIYKNALEESKSQETTKKALDYFAEMPAVMNSSNGMTLVNFGKIINGETAQYSYKARVGQELYNVQGVIKSEGNSLVFEDDYNKTNSEVLSAGEVRHDKNSADGTIAIQLITTKNIGSLSTLGEMKLFIFKYK